MRKDYQKKILLTCFYSNLLFIILHVLFLIAMIIFPSQLIHLIKSIDDHFIYRVLLFLIFIPTLFLLIYNIWFAYKKDRYSKALIYLFIFQSFYSPYYYYQVNFKNRKLINQIKSDPVLGNSILVEEYDNDEDLKNDL